MHGWGISSQSSSGHKQIHPTKENTVHYKHIKQTEKTNQISFHLIIGIRPTANPSNNKKYSTKAANRLKANN
jgi:hypothetical protein